MAELHREELRETIVDLAHMTSLAFDQVIRIFINHYSSPDVQLNTDGLKTCYSELKMQFEQKMVNEAVRGQIGMVHDVFVDLSSTFEELTSSSTKMMCIIENSLDRDEREKGKGQDLEEKAARDHLGKQAGKSEVVAAQSSGIFNRLSTLFRKDEQYLKADLGKDGSGMRYDAAKKKWIFEDDESNEGEVVEKKLPPKAGGVAKKQSVESVSEEGSIVNDLLKPRGRNLGGPKTGGKEKAGEEKKIKQKVVYYATMQQGDEVESLESKRKALMERIKESIALPSLDSGKAEKVFTLNQVLAEISKLPDKVHQNYSNIQMESKKNYEKYCLLSAATQTDTSAFDIDNQICLYDSQLRMGDFVSENLINFLESVLEMVRSQGTLEIIESPDQTQEIPDLKNHSSCLLFLLKNLSRYIKNQSDTVKRYEEIIVQWKDIFEVIYTSYRTKVDLMKSWEQEIMKLNVLLDRRSRELNIKRQEISVLKLIYASTKSDVEHYKDECSKLYSAYKVNISQIADQDHQLTEMISEIDILHATLDDKKKQIYSLDEHINLMESENAKLGRRLADSLAENKITNQNIDRVRSEYQILTDKYYDTIHKSNSMIENIQGEKDNFLSSLRQEKERISEELEKTTSMLAKRQRETEESCRELERMEKKVVGLEKKVKEKEEELGEVKEKVNQWKKKVEEAENDYSKARRELKICKETNEDLRAEVSRLSEGLEKGKREVEVLKESEVELKKELKEKKDEVNRIREQLEEQTRKKSLESDMTGHEENRIASGSKINPKSYLSFQKGTPSSRNKPKGLAGQESNASDGLVINKPDQETQIIKLKNEINDLNSKINEQVRKFEEVQAELENVKSENLKFSVNIELLESTHSKEVCSLQDAISSSQSECSKLREELEMAESSMREESEKFQLMESIKNNQELKDIIETLNEQLETAKIDIGKYYHQLRSSIQREKSKSEEVVSLRMQLDEAVLGLEDNRNLMKSVSEEYEKERETFLHQINSLQDELEEARSLLSSFKAQLVSERDAKKSSKPIHEELIAAQASRDRYKELNSKQEEEKEGLRVRVRETMEAMESIKKKFEASLVEKEDLERALERESERHRGDIDRLEKTICEVEGRERLAKKELEEATAQKDEYWRKLEENQENLDRLMREMEELRSRKAESEEGVLEEIQGEVRKLTIETETQRHQVRKAEEARAELERRLGEVSQKWMDTNRSGLARTAGENQEEKAMRVRIQGLEKDCSDQRGMIGLLEVKISDLAGKESEYREKIELLSNQKEEMAGEAMRHQQKINELQDMIQGMKKRIDGVPCEVKERSHSPSQQSAESSSKLNKEPRSLALQIPPPIKSSSTKASPANQSPRVVEFQEPQFMINVDIEKYEEEEEQKKTLQLDHQKKEQNNLEVQKRGGATFFKGISGFFTSNEKTPPPKK